MLSPWQRAVADSYACGDFSRVQTLEECRDVGDTLFTFLMIELDPGEGCESWKEAERRLDTAQRDVEAAVAAVEKQSTLNPGE